MISWSRTLRTADYVAGLSAIAPRMNDLQRQLLVEQYYAPNRQVTAEQLARLAEVTGGYRPVNAQYGRLGRMFCDQVGERPDVRPRGSNNRGKERLWAVWSRGWRGPDGFVWQMLPAVAEALEILGWVTAQAVRLSEEVTASGRLIEGAVCRVVINAYERNPVARARCIAHYGPTCAVCGFNFAGAYGPLAEGFIHVHHVKPLSEIGEGYEVDPVADLRPVCPNCHAVIHLGGECRSIKEVKQLLELGTTPNQLLQPTRRQKQRRAAEP